MKDFSFKKRSRPFAYNGEANTAVSHDTPKFFRGFHTQVGRSRSLLTFFVFSEIPTASERKEPILSNGQRCHLSDFSTPTLLPCPKTSAQKTGTKEDNTENKSNTGTSEVIAALYV